MLHELVDIVIVPINERDNTTEVGHAMFMIVDINTNFITFYDPAYVIHKSYRYRAYLHATAQIFNQACDTRFHTTIERAAPNQYDNPSYECECSKFCMQYAENYILNYKDHTILRKGMFDPTKCSLYRRKMVYDILRARFSKIIASPAIPFLKFLLYIYFCMFFYLFVL